MPRFELPEMLRLSLDAVVLKVKMLGIKTEVREGGEAAAAALADGAAPPAGRAAGGRRYVRSAKAVLAQAIQPPDMRNVDAALTKLAALGALASAEDTADVTPFGRLLATFPGDLALGRLVAFGAVLGPLPDAIIMAASLTLNQDIFLLPHAAKAESAAE
jgi:HrpA-like RNA helicase